MRVALVSAVDPYPTDAGKKVVLAGFVDYFAERYGADNVHYLKVGAAPQGNFPVPVHVVPGPRRVEVLRTLATKVPTGQASLQEAALGSPTTAREISRLLAEIKPDLHVYDTVRMAQYAPADVAARQLCYLDDLFSVRYTRMLEAAQLYPDVDSNPMGNFGEHIPKRLHALTDHRKSRNGLLRLERALVRRSEDRVARAFGRCLLVNDEEAGVLTRRTGVAPGRVVSVRPLIAPPNALGRGNAGAPEFVFLGLLSLPHNDDGLRWFLRDVWPVVCARLPGAHLRVIGRHAGQEALALAENLSESVTVEGYVPDLGEALRDAAALVNPLRFGSGIKLKVIEALGRALPVVSTTIGAEGIATGPGSGILVGDHPDEIADLLAGLTDPVRNAEISADAQRHFESTYARPAVFAAYDAAFTVP